MKLTRLERLSLSNQFLVLEKLYPEMAASYMCVRKAIEEGIEAHYDEAFQSISADVVSIEESELVIDILDMYSDLLRSYNQSKKNFGILESRVAFPGFDACHERAYLKYAKYLIHDLGRYQEFKHKPLSHDGVISRFSRQMLAKWKEFKQDKEDAKLLTTEQIRAVLEARGGLELFTLSKARYLRAHPFVAKLQLGNEG